MCIANMRCTSQHSHLNFKYPDAPEGKQTGKLDYTSVVGVLPYLITTVWLDIVFVLRERAHFSVCHQS